MSELGGGATRVLGLLWSNLSKGVAEGRRRVGARQGGGGGWRVMNIEGEAAHYGVVGGVDDLENLEWLSQFVDDSTSGLSLLCPAQSFESGSNSGEPQKLRSPRFPLPVHVKARSTRSREPRGRPWTLASPPSPAARLFSTPSFSHTSSPFLLAIPVQGTEWLPISEKPPAKRRKRRAVLDGVSGRRCTHCQVQKTPQWRTGPIGPKTLCNACGVRYKSGRLFPEYRPAFSPTFSHGQHSNSHRKVVELRRKKESEEMVVGPGFEQVLMGDSLSRFI